MRPTRKGVSKARLILALAPLALAGCVAGDYLYDYPQGGYYYGSEAGYYSGYYSNDYSNYYGSPGYYRDQYYRPRGVYYDHDHDRYDCRHESHRDRRPHDGRDRDDRERGDRDRDGKDGNGAGPSPHRLPPPGAAPLRRTPRVTPQQGSDPAPKATPASVPCKGRAKCGPSGEAPEPKPGRKERDDPRERRR